MSSSKKPRAIVLTGGLLHTSDAKTAHGLIRESERFEIVAIIDEQNAGRDAGLVLDGSIRNIPVVATISDGLQLKPEFCVVGVATTGGRFPGDMLEDVRAAIRAGVSVVNGLHDYLNEREDIVSLARDHGVQLIDIRRPKKRADLHFWTGKIRSVKTPIVAVLGTDCSLGKRTTTRFLVEACANAGIKAGMVYTGQTGWLQGGEYGFILDSTLNDFVGGEMENAVLSCIQGSSPDLVFIEGQAALRNPSGPCGSEMLISGNAKSVILVHAPKRKYFEHLEEWGPIPDIEAEIELIRQYGSKVIAIAINTEHCSAEEAKAFKKQYEEQFGIPAVLPILEGCGDAIPAIKSLLHEN